MLCAARGDLRRKLGLLVLTSLFENLTLLAAVRGKCNDVQPRVSISSLDLRAVRMNAPGSHRYWRK